MTQNSIKKIPPSCLGFLVVLVMWIMFLIADAIDEYIIDVDSFIGLWLCILVPLVYVVLYIVICLKKRPARKSLSTYNGFYFSSALLMSFALIALSGMDSFPIKQKVRDFFTLNSVEYGFYGIAIFLVVGIIVGVFHIFDAVARNSRKHKN